VTVDPRAASGFTSNADAYERGRPSYPAEAVASLARELGLTTASTALDLAAGTGKLTRVLLPVVGRVIAVEPSQPMLAQLQDVLPAVDGRAGTAEAIPLPDASVDAVFVGDAFHWFGTAPAILEIARVLSPGGGLALLWNRAHWTAAELPWLPEFGALVDPYRRAAGSYPGDRWKEALRDSGLFEPPSSTEADRVHRIGVEELVALVSSWSWIANLPEGERGAVLRRVRELVGGHDRLALPYRTEIHWTRLRADAR
jgi:SAM-dependent methyltransferase